MRPFSRGCVLLGQPDSRLEADSVDATLIRKLFCKTFRKLNHDLNRFGIETQRLKNLHNSLFFLNSSDRQKNSIGPPHGYYCLSRHHHYQLLPVGFDEAFGSVVASTVAIVDDEGCSDLLKTD